jgi:hypothetical protein
MNCMRNASSRRTTRRQITLTATPTKLQFTSVKFATSVRALGSLRTGGVPAQHLVRASAAERHPRFRNRDHPTQVTLPRLSINATRPACITLTTVAAADITSAPRSRKNSSLRCALAEVGWKQETSAAWARDLLEPRIAALSVSRRFVLLPMKMICSIAPSLAQVSIIQRNASRGAWPPVGRQSR